MIDEYKIIDTVDAILGGHSFDRVDNSKGYISGNVVACDNQRKNNLSLVN